MRRITDRDIDRLIREELTHTQVKSDISDYIGTRDFEKKIKEIVVKKLPLVEDSPNFVDKLTKWFTDRLPLEKREPEKKA